ncbi:hypothetical protein [Vibrio alginolyticus]|uniref:hypothetical protein n=1 Tax=Vibrio alginolyticus TaxID=663 RepID=UPI0007209232|nr:hypothetical protein [Vibrio alginolyticus]ALR91294.1 hypothetical protein AT730_02405 [Vibrio alginolyticus]MBY7707964.1 hypothetical protein [Vibrio alginolyticus]
MSQRNKWLEKIGRTGLKTVKFDVGTGGGKPTFDQLDFAHALTGLGNEATAWAMYAYSNTEDEKSLNFITARLSKIIQRKHPSIPTKAVVGLVKITLREHLLYAPSTKTRKGCSVTARSLAMGIARKTYYAHSNAIDSATQTVMELVRLWEEQIAESVQKKLNSDI